MRPAITRYVLFFDEYSVSGSGSGLSVPARNASTLARTNLSASDVRCVIDLPQRPLLARSSGEGWKTNEVTARWRRRECRRRRGRPFGAVENLSPSCRAFGRSREPFANAESVSISDAGLA